MKKSILNTLSIILISSFLFGCANKSEKSVNYTMSIDGYHLVRSIILSRHNIRSPLSGGDSTLGKITPHSWYNWTSKPSELSIKGGALEVAMGQYYRKWFEKEGILSDDFKDQEFDSYFYANAKQRTMATARYFAAGLLPTMNPEIHINVPLDTMDPVFNPQLTFISDSYIEAAKKEINEMYANSIADLKDNYSLLSKTIDFKKSELYKSGEFTEFKTDDTEVHLELNKEPYLTGSLKNGCSVSDALTLQYYEEMDTKKAAFGHNLSLKDFKKITEIKDLYGDVLFSSPLVSVNVARPLLEQINNAPFNKLTFLCGHDSNINSVLSALYVKDFELPNSLERKTPIGAKLTINQYTNKNGELYVGIFLVYQNVDQLRNVSMLDLDHSPTIVQLQFKYMQNNEQGLYNYADFYNHIFRQINRYDEIKEKYNASSNI